MEIIGLKLDQVWEKLRELIDLSDVPYVMEVQEQPSFVVNYW